MKLFRLFSVFTLLVFAAFPLCGGITAELNSILGAPFFDPGTPAESLWESGIQNLLRRLNRARLFFAASGGRSEILSASGRGLQICTVPAVEFRIAVKEENGKRVPSRIDVFFINKGDNGKNRKLTQDIRRTGRKIEVHLDDTIGAHAKAFYGPKEMRRLCSSWETQEAVFLLERSAKEYVILHILPPAKQQSMTSYSARTKAVKSLNLADNVTTNDFGDVVINNIPMVNQGQKGYCVPATIERVLLYFGITNLNMHQIADAGKTKKGGGSRVTDVNDSLRRVLKRADIQIKSLGEVSVRAVAPLISKGCPVMWCLYATPLYERRRKENTAARQRAGSAKAWKKALKRQKTLPTMEFASCAHVCLIVGYNEETNEIAVSNSWGNQELIPSWVAVKDAKHVSQHAMYGYVPPRDK